MRNSEHGRSPWVAAIGLLVAACGGGPAGSAPATPLPAATTVASAPTPTASLVAAATPHSTAILPGEAWLIYAWYPDTLQVVRPDGSDAHDLATGIEAVQFAPAWSPDGERIAFVVKDDATPDGGIWTAAADGSGAALLYGRDECNGGAFWPVFSPDGTKLAMVCYVIEGDVGLSSISVLDLATLERTDLATFTYPETSDNPPSWAPDGSALTFEILKWDPTDEFIESFVVATVATTGGKVRRLTDPELMAAHPDWSPDGTRIAFNTYDTGNIHGITEPSNVYTIAPDGTGLRQLSTASTDGTLRLGQPFWSVDGSRIWVSIARDYEKDSNDQFKNTLGWVDATSGAFVEIGTEGKRFRERPLPE